MTCAEAMRRLLDLDNGEPAPPELCEHLGACEGCGTEATRLAAAMRELSGTAELSALDEAAEEALTARIMAAVRAEPAAAAATVPLRNWVAGAAVMVAGIAGLRFSSPLEWLRLSFGPVIEVAVGLILGLILTVYLCLLVGSNLHRVERLFRIR